ncbi:MAG: M23 family metallopeptidase [bacterium]|nr:M23 family metallopeptidase [bacterium]
MKEKMNQLFKDKLVLVMLVLGLLTLVAAAGVVSMKKSGEESPYLDLQEEGEEYIAAETPAQGENSMLAQNEGEFHEILSEEEKTQNVSGEKNEWKAKNEGIAEEQTAGSTEEKDAQTSQMQAEAVALNFPDTESLAWPIVGNVIQMYSMDSTIYFPTLEQYKCSSGIALQGEVSEPVSAPANAMVLEIGNNEEIGNYVTMDLGGSYTLLCGQLKDIQVAEGQYLSKGQVLGYVAEPTKYYAVEGSNLYLELQQEQKPVDPLDYLE